MCDLAFLPLFADWALCWSACGASGASAKAAHAPPSRAVPVQLDINTSRREVLYRLGHDQHCNRIQYITPCRLEYCPSSSYLEYDLELFTNEFVPPAAP